MTVAEDVDMKADRLFHIQTHIIYKIVCAPKAWTGDQVSDVASRENPPGTSANRWVVSDLSDSDQEDNPFKSSNPQPCNDDPDRVHWLLNC